MLRAAQVADPIAGKGDLDRVAGADEIRNPENGAAALGQRRVQALEAAALVEEIRTRDEPAQEIELGCEPAGIDQADDVSRGGVFNLYHAADRQAGALGAIAQERRTGKRPAETPAQAAGKER